MERRHDARRPPNNIYGPNYYHFASGTHIEVKDGTSGTITLSAFSLNASTPAADPGQGNDGVPVSANVTAAGSSVTISPDGTVKDTNGKYNILVGQGFSPKMVGMPGTGVTYLWTGPN